MYTHSTKSEVPYNNDNLRVDIITIGCDVYTPITILMTCTLWNMELTSYKI